MESDQPGSLLGALRDLRRHCRQKGKHHRDAYNACHTGRWPPMSHHDCSLLRPFIPENTYVFPSLVHCARHEFSMLMTRPPSRIYSRKGFEHPALITTLMLPVWASTPLAEP